MKLSKKTLAKIRKISGLSLPDETIFSLPEKIIQFGTGVLLRGLPDYFVDKANKQGKFNGRIVVIKSTQSGTTDAFTDQDGLYTIAVRGIENNTIIDEYWVNAAISRVLNANDAWSEILSCAANPALQIVISNTTEVGIALMKDDDIFAAPPTSFPGKLLAFLYHRYTIFNGSHESGMVIIPTELIVNNGKKLKEIVLELAHINHLNEGFIQWLHESNDFCNSLVDRIVPGKLPQQEAQFATAQLGYQDELMIMSEAYRLWAIETCSDRTKAILSFAEADSGVIIDEDITMYRELKLRLLNGTHTFSCGLAFLAGFDTVKEAMGNRIFTAFITNLMLYEIVPVILSEKLTQQKAKQFSLQVIDRFKNPAIAHHWISITMQYTSKMKMRNVPIVSKYLLQFKSIPKLMALGFAGYLLFMKTQLNNAGQPIQEQYQQQYIVQDDYAIQIHKLWVETSSLDLLIQKILSDQQFMDMDVATIPDFVCQVKSYLTDLLKGNVLQVIENIVQEQNVYTLI
ncbi:MAG: tagaturonate reductase [Sphingobacteriales bacterium]|uniref:tagaturonate reductase n=1 Tax=Hydrotalea flava TaxID=714549 RepID=UPI00082A39A6|nr:tagaturonate reductase [Hydrotalea flava]RTL55933.1 MAG: tagaturonate reductase [Sphingobacteriales bacterium]